MSRWIGDSNQRAPANCHAYVVSPYGRSVVSMQCCMRPPFHCCSDSGPIENWNWAAPVYSPWC